ncbi:MAG: amino acid ABC transporter substrate-binding protein [Anaerolineae bacterium]|nr:amino acid ABC transporter substrate-binding protein [Anaerolineae bacterium]
MSPAIRAGRRRLLAGAGALFAGLFVTAGCGGRLDIRFPRRPPKLYRLGLVAPFEGLFAATGYEALEAARSQIQEWNDRYRPAGFQVQVWAVDDSNDADQARLRALELAADPHLVAVVGHLAPETSSTAAPTYLASGLLQVSPVPLATTASGQEPGLVVSLAPSLSDLAELLTPQVEGALRSEGILRTGLNLAPAPADAEKVAADCGLLELAYRLSTDPHPPRDVSLPLGYCPAALVKTFPEITFHAATTGPAPSAASLVASATHWALEAVAAAGPRVTREAVVAAALATIQAAGWRREEGVYRPQPQSLDWYPCPAQE